MGIKMCSLVPTYGRRPELLANALACFHNQTHPLEDRMLILYDDLGNIQLTNHERSKLFEKNIYVVSDQNRCPTLPEKYERIISQTKQAVFGWVPDLYVVQDDDDIYMPWHFEAMAKFFTQDGLLPPVWLHPQYCWSIYTGTHKIEKADGRFWGSTGFTRNILLETKFPTTDKCEYDQMMLKNLGSVCEPLQPKGVPSYVYVWQTSYAKHASSNPGTGWYNKAVPQYTNPIQRLQPIMNMQTTELVHAISKLTVNDLNRYLVV